MARREADLAGADEALLLNDREEVVTASSANLFWISGNTVCTPPVEAGALPGITRGVVRELCATERFDYAERRIGCEELLRSEGVFVTASTFGLTPVSRIDEHEFGLPKMLEVLMR
jgi:branched-chain amino acid aminotransferase